MKRSRTYRCWSQRGGRITDALFRPFGLTLKPGYRCYMCQAKRLCKTYHADGRRDHAMSSRDNLIVRVVFCPDYCTAYWRHHTDPRGSSIRHTVSHSFDCRGVEIISECTLSRMSKRVAAEDIAALRLSLEAIAEPKGCRRNSKAILLDVLNRVDGNE